MFNHSRDMPFPPPILDIEASGFGLGSYPIEVGCILPDGRTLRVVRQPHPLGGVLLLFSDITDELKLRSRFNAQIQVQTATLDKLNDAVAVFGSDGRIRLHNEAFDAFWGVTGEALDAAGVDTGGPDVGADAGRALTLLAAPPALAVGCGRRPALASRQCRRMPCARAQSLMRRISSGSTRAWSRRRTVWSSQRPTSVKAPRCLASSSSASSLPPVRMMRPALITCT